MKGPERLFISDLKQGLGIISLASISTFPPINVLAELPCTDHPIYTTSDFPDDLDTTSLALSNVDCDPETTASVMDEMLEYLSEDGIVQVRVDHRVLLVLW